MDLHYCCCWFYFILSSDELNLIEFSAFMIDHINKYYIYWRYAYILASIQQSIHPYVANSHFNANNSNANGARKLNWIASLVHKPIAFHFWGSRFYHMADISCFGRVDFILFYRVFFSFFGLSSFQVFCCCCFCWWWFLFYLRLSFFFLLHFNVWFFIHPPSLLSTVFVFGHRIIITWWYREMFAFTYTADIKGVNTLIYIHISTRTHLHCTRAIYWLRQK